VADVDMTINRGETFALVGESGSGKSTIAKMIVGLLEPTTGQITFDGMRLDGTDGSRMRALRSRFQMIFQDPFASLNPRWRVGDIIAEPIHRFGLLKGAAVSLRVGELLDTVGLVGDRRRQVSRTSSRAGSASASPSPAPCPRSPNSSSATNPRRRSMCRCRPRS
jgi:ABC-type glutathione transport system ATPase component